LRQTWMPPLNIFLKLYALCCSSALTVESVEVKG
jgi:hypothetical protein